jgi:hypothetical protein
MAGSDCGLSFVKGRRRERRKEGKKGRKGKERKNPSRIFFFSSF